ncbi:deaD [Wigglesworthia glossinidia endosymbiont of Glossina brevipalpis]|uniref:ATP-dependent RNA helicase DeaD n=1 Tax=Wigglesworthia glossinidia brevipalpis TaxID=36870 RepID=Q8D2Y1_WIGBR|nr:deaD [Wigglesworthia glossinidia endosymbiont of Glossina brevipalpis]
MNKKELSFSELGLKDFILLALNDLGYKKPSPIQEKCIPFLLKGYDVLGIAQTGSGKTAAFFLPLLNNIDLKLKLPQIIILTPTRELALQIKFACCSLSKYIKEINIIALYGGQNYSIQIKSLKRNPQIVVGTPGRILDLLNKKYLNLSEITSFVLDEADEMLRMGFIEDVENIFLKSSKQHQTILFSATMPAAIHRITKRFMKKPKEIRIKASENTRPNIKQNYWIVYGLCKIEALLRFLEVEIFDAVIIFVRTKNATLEVSDVLEKNGYNSSSLNGDMNQILREKTLNRFKTGLLDILVATDVAARGLDVDRISLVINYDIPLDVESYIHRIGRTGRAGRTGKALMFVENRERKILYNIERNIKEKLSQIKLPSVELLCKKRLNNFSEKIKNQINSLDLNKYQNLLSKIISFIGISDVKIISAALLKVAQKNKPLIISPDNFFNKNKKINLLINKNNKRKKLNIIKNKKKSISLYKAEIGKKDGIESKHIVRTMINLGKIKSNDIGSIKIFFNYSTIEIYKKIPLNLLSILSKSTIFKKSLNLKLLNHNKISKKPILKKIGSRLSNRISKNTSNKISYNRQI